MACADAPQATTIDLVLNQAWIDDLEGMVDVPRGIEGVEVGLLFRQTNTGDVKVSFRSSGPTDVNALAVPVLRHRIVTNFNAEAEGITPVDVINRLLEGMKPARTRAA